jgi:hypothetical protein
MLAIMVTHVAMFPVSVTHDVLIAVLDLSGSGLDVPDNGDLDRFGTWRGDEPAGDGRTLVQMTTLGHVADPHSVEPLRAARPLGLAVLHPLTRAENDIEAPFETSVGEASGCLLLPGIPEVGLDHRAAWASVREDGLVARLQSTAHADRQADHDVAFLADILAA